MTTVKEKVASVAPNENAGKEVTPVMEKRELLKTQKGNVYRIDPRKIVADETFNIRKDYGQIEELKLSIIENGVLVPLRGRKKGDNYHLTDGFRRNRAIQELLNEGYDIGRVPLIAEAQNYSDEQRMFDMFITQDNKKLNSLEEGELFLRLKNYGYNASEIAKKIGRTPAHVSNMLMLVQSPKRIQNRIKNGEISATTALSMIRKHGETASEKIDKGVEEAKKTGKKKATAKNLSKKTKQPKEPKNPTYTAYDPSMQLRFLSDMVKDKEISSVVEKLADGIEKELTAEELAESLGIQV